MSLFLFTSSLTSKSPANRETEIMPQNTSFKPMQSEQDPVSEDMVVQMLQKSILTAW